jgi:exosortase/archaeosortase family protein
MNNDLNNEFQMKQFLSFVIKFIVFFILFYYGTKTVIALSATEGHYNQYVANHLDYVSLIKRSLIWGTRLLLSFFHIDTYQVDPFVVRIKDGVGVRIAHGCVGYGVDSFWLAYVLANSWKVKMKAKLIVIGLFVLWLINVLRISLLLVTMQHNKSMPLGLDHHTWFNIISYGLILLFLFLSENRIVRSDEASSSMK